MSQEFYLTSPLKDEVLAWVASNAAGQIITLVVQGSHGLSKEAFLVLTNHEILFFKVKNGKPWVEKRMLITNYTGMKVLIGTLQISFKNEDGKAEIVTIALKKNQAKEIQTIVWAKVKQELAKKKIEEQAGNGSEGEVTTKGTYIGQFTPESGVQFYERSSSKYSDRKLSNLLQPGGSPIKVYSNVLECQSKIYKIDNYVTVDVVFDGQTQVSRRPTLTRMGLLSPLPGSALLAGFALGKKETHDDREVRVVISHPDWSLSIRVKPSDLGPAKSLASRINSIADSITRTIKENNTVNTFEQSDKVSKLKEVKILKDSGFLTSKEAEQMKKEIFEG
jgi:hypothetical protein